MSPLSEFLDHPGLAGPFGALMDEYARAAAEICTVVEAVPLDRFTRLKPENEPQTQSIQAISGHLGRAAHGYANAIRTVRGLEVTPAGPLVTTREELRPRLAEVLRYTEGALAGLYEADEATYSALRFEVHWGPTYDPEMLLEHAIVHLLRHRRQIERWPV